MAVTKTQARRERLREALAEAAERRIAEAGMRSLTARDLAADAGCSVGAIYTIYRDMEALAAAVNSRTTARLEQAVGDAFAGDTGEPDPKRRLVLLGTTYFDFVVANPRLWSAIFEAGTRADAGAAEHRQAEHARLIRHIVAPLARLMPEMPEARLALVARALFAAVHGIVSLGQQRQFMPVPPAEVAAQIAFIVEAFCDGIALQRGKSANG